MASLTDTWKALSKFFPAAPGAFSNSRVSIDRTAPACNAKFKILPPQNFYVLTCSSVDALGRMFSHASLASAGAADSIRRGRRRKYLNVPIATDVRCSYRYECPYICN